MSHARAVLARDYPGAAIQQARKARIKRGGRWISGGEDIFGCFDLLALAPSGALLLIQVTTWTGGGGVSARRHKVRHWIEATFPAAPSPSPEVWVIAWVRGRHFRKWSWGWGEGTWSELEPVPSPSLTRPGKAERGARASRKRSPPLRDPAE